nr:hypothetical protein GCM10020063_079080 [Dactylosporangium thailandense]
MVSPPVSHTAVSGLPLGQVGVAVTGSIVAGSSAGFVHSSHAAWVVIGACGFAVLALGLISTSG